MKVSGSLSKLAFAGLIYGLGFVYTVIFLCLLWKGEGSAFDKSTMTVLFVIVMALMTKLLFDIRTKVKRQSNSTSTNN